MKKLILVLLLLIPYINNAQNVCGTDSMVDFPAFTGEQLKSEVLRLKNTNRDEPRVILVNFVIVNDDDGKNGLAPIYALGALEKLNEAFKEIDIRFELCGGINFIDNTKYLKSRISVSVPYFNDFHFDNVINVFFVKKVYIGNMAYGGVAFPSVRRIIMVQNGSGDAKTLIHEFGHVLSLPHTHATNGGQEYVDGTDCYLRGDRFCDTPADPILFGLVDSNCNYFGNQVDGHGDYFEPDESNYMSYSRFDCRDSFSSEQYAAMSLNLGGSNQHLIGDCNEVHDISLFSPTKSLSLIDFKKVTFKVNIDNVNGTIINKNVKLIAFYTDNDGTRYQNEEIIIEKDIFIDENHMEVQLDFPFSEALAKTKYIKVMVNLEDSVSEIYKRNNNLSISVLNVFNQKGSLIWPNPVGEHVQLFMQNGFNGLGVYEIFTLDGKKVQDGSFIKKNRDKVININVENFPEGLYMISFSANILGERETLKFFKNHK